MKNEILELSKQDKNSDYEFPIKIGNEIYRIKNRLIKMPIETDGFEQLLKSIERMQEILNEEGFEVIDLINLDYNEGMTVKARFVQTDNPLENKIISKVIKPQINYNKQLVQIADIEVKMYKKL